MLLLGLCLVVLKYIWIKITTRISAVFFLSVFTFINSGVRLVNGHNCLKQTLDHALKDKGSVSL